MTLPTVSVIMAAYNGAALIGETLASLGAQTLADWEAIVVDDRSTDNTRAIVATWPDPRVRLVPLAENGGVVRARNRALAEASGRYIAALDQDDLCLPERLARQVAYLDAHPEVALVGAAVDFLRAGALRRSTYPVHTTPALVGWLSWIENPLVWSSVMIRTQAARALSPFILPEMLYADDFDLYHRIRPHGGIARLDEVLVHYRQHEASASQRFTETMEAGAVRALADAHAPLLGAAAEEVARLLVRYHSGGRPVPDRATLKRLGDAIATLQAVYLDRFRPGAADRRLIRWETARRWARIGRTGLRAGTLGIADVIAVRPPHLGLGYAGPAILAWSQLIGTARQTLAAKIIRPGPSRANT